MRTINPSPEQINLWNSKQNQKRSAEIELLKPLMLDLARKAGSHGVTTSDLRLTAVQRGLLSGHEQGRELSYLNAVPRAAGLVRTEEFRRSVIEKAHGNLNVVWVLPLEAERVA